MKNNEKKIEEQRKKEQTTTNKPSSGSSNNTPKRYGSISQCESIKATFEMDDATRKVFAIYGYDFETISGRLSAHYQTIASYINGVCAYETIIVVNKTYHKYYHSIIDGSEVAHKQEHYEAGTIEDARPIIINYFITNYGANESDIFVQSIGGTVNDRTMTGTIIYNSISYNFSIVQKTGVIESVKEK